jgi:hypothetical protein
MESFTKLLRRKAAPAPDKEKYNPKPIVVMLGGSSSSGLNHNNHEERKGLIGAAEKKGHEDDDMAKLGKKDNKLISTIGTCCFQFVVIVITIVILHKLGATDPNKGLDDLIDQGHQNFDSVVKSGLEGLGIGKVDPNVHLKMDFASGQDPGTVSLGPHTAKVEFDAGCASPQFWMRLEGVALVGVDLKEVENDDNQEGLTWKGTFYLPEPGMYKLVGHWYGCYDGAKSNSKLISVPDIKAVPGVTPKLTSNPAFPTGAWIYDSKLDKYIWTNPEVGLAQSHIRESKTIVFTDEATLDEEGTYQLTSLDKNDRICWVGSQSAEVLNKVFLELRKVVAARVRASNFMYFPVMTLDNNKPDALWSRKQKREFKRCKQIFVSMDEFHYPLTQSDYKMKIGNFLDHLTRAFPDENIPIWVLTMMMESPEDRGNCYDQHLPTTSKNPCNSALQDLFEDSPFEPRVNLLDNTDLTLPQLGDSKKEVATVIALRCAVLIGKQKQTWTQAGLRSTTHGWLRGDVAINNVDLVPYTEWSI